MLCKPRMAGVIVALGCVACTDPPPPPDPVAASVPTAQPRFCGESLPPSLEGQPTASGALGCPPKSRASYVLDQHAFDRNDFAVTPALGPALAAQYPAHNRPAPAPLPVVRRCGFHFLGKAFVPYCLAPAP